MRQDMRVPLVTVHRWTGLTVGMLLLFLALTGLALAFREELMPVVDPALHASGQCAQPLPLDRQVGAARTAHATGRLDTVILYPEERMPSLVRFSDDAQFYVDTCAGQVLAGQARWGGLFGRLEQLHRFRFLDSNDVANAFTGGAALVLAIVFVGGGLALWWPSSRRTLTTSMTWRPHLRGRAFDLNLHRLAGVYLSIILLGVALTSLPLAFTWVRTTLDIATRSEAPSAKPKSQLAPAAAKPLALAAVWERAAATFDHPSKVVLTAGRKRADPVEIYAIERGAPHDEARSYAWFDAYDGRLLRAEPWTTSTLSNRIYRTAGAIHAGEYGLALQLLEFLGTLAIPVLAWTGIRSWLRDRRRRRSDEWMLRVRAVRDETIDVKSFELVRLDGRPLPVFEAGAHVEVNLGPGLVRAYSLCGDPGATDHWLIAVKRAPGSRGGSRAMHERVHVGDVLAVGRPRNHFPIARRARHHVLLGAGIGVTPLMAMAHALRASGASWELHAVVRDDTSMPLRARLQGQGFDGHVHVHARLGPEGVAALVRDLVATRRERAQLYLCGPRRFMDDAMRLATPAWPADAIRVEHFDGDAQALARPRHPFEVELARSRRTILVPADRSIVEVLHDHGVTVATSCREGVCGSCATAVLDGRCDHRDAFLTERERVDGRRILPCVSRANGPRLVLDL